MFRVEVTLLLAARIGLSLFFLERKGIDGIVAVGAADGDGGAAAGSCGGGWPWKMDRPAIWIDFFLDMEDWQQLWMDRQTRDTRCYERYLGDN